MGLRDIVLPAEDNDKGSWVWVLADVDKEVCCRLSEPLETIKLEEADEGVWAWWLVSLEIELPVKAEETVEIALVNVFKFEVDTRADEEDPGLAKNEPGIDPTLGAEVCTAPLDVLRYDNEGDLIS